MWIIRPGLMVGDEFPVDVRRGIEQVEREISRRAPTAIREIATDKKFKIRHVQFLEFDR